MTNSTVTVCYEADFYPFGGERVITGTCSQNYKFAGMEQDSETALNHTLFRQQSSSLGRWYSPDPLAGNILDPQSLNRYAYVLNNPLSMIDPLGLQCIEIGNGVVADNGIPPRCTSMTGDQPGQVNVYGGAPPPVGFFENTEIGRSLSLDDPNDYAMAALAFDSGRAQAQQAQRNQEEPGDLKIGSWNINHPSPESCGTVRAVAIGGLAGGGGFLALGAMFPVIAPVTDIIGIPLVVSGGVFGIYYATFCRSW